MADSYSLTCEPMLIGVQAGFQDEGRHWNTRTSKVTELIGMTSQRCNAIPDLKPCRPYNSDFTARGGDKGSDAHAFRYATKQFPRVGTA
jgi:hypothetical protein